MNTNSTIDAQLQNWENFCQYHIGDWYGIWTSYSPKGEAIESFKCVRSFHTNVDRSEINHQNHYTYADGKSKSQTFGPYKKPTTRALFLDNSFSWGSTKVEFEYSFGFETGFKYENRRASVAVVCNSRGNLQQIVTTTEHLGSFTEKPPHSLVKEVGTNWQGTSIRMTPDWIVSSALATSWTRLEDLGDNYTTLHFPDNISISCPQQIEGGKEFCLVADWRVNNTLLQRGIRRFDASEFKDFTLKVFTHAF